MRALDIPTTFQARLRVRRVSIVVVTAAVLISAVVLPAGTPEFAVPLAGPLSFLGEVALFTLLVGGWLGDELRSGAALFWIQTPHSPVALYGSRFVGVAVLAALLASLLPVVAAALLAVLGHPDGSLEILVRLRGIPVVLATVAVLVWGMGGWGIRGDAWAGPLVGAILLALEMVAEFVPGRLGPLAGPADLLGMPVDDLATCATLLSGSGGEPAAAAHALPWLAAWVVIGALGVSRTARRAAVADRAA